ncbi:MAG: TIR domain-containing protein [Bacteroidales bacterium]|nr:TIR domain-containing protein [Bacteroidales bacterium]
MAHKTFISYKYSEAKTLRDVIVKALGSDVSYYMGETSDSPDLTDTSTDNIKRKLSDMMYNTSVTIVIISPNMIKSKWIDWEIEYCLKEISRQNRTSKTNGILGIIMKYNYGYNWFKSTTNHIDGCSAFSYEESLLYPIIKKNRYNQKPPVYTCINCKTVNALTGSYISFVEEETFLMNPQRYIDNAFDKSEELDGYELSKKR